MPSPIVPIALNLAFNLIQQAITDGEISREEATKRVNETQAEKAASFAALDDAIKRAEGQ